MSVTFPRCAVGFIDREYRWKEASYEIELPYDSISCLTRAGLELVIKGRNQQSPFFGVGLLPRSEDTAYVATEDTLYPESEFEDMAAFFSLNPEGQEFSFIILSIFEFF